MYYFNETKNDPAEPEKKELVPMTEWEKAPVSELIDTKNELYSRYLFATEKNMGNVVRQLREMLVKIDTVIQRRMSS